MLATFLLPFYSILAPFWVHFGFILAPFYLFGGVLGRRRETSSKFLDFGIPLGSPRGPSSIKNRYFFQWKNAPLFLSIFNSFFAPFWRLFGLHFASKTTSGTKKGIFWKKAFRLNESSILEGRGTQKPSKRRPKMDWKINWFFHWKNHRKLSPKGAQKGPKIRQ